MQVADIFQMQLDIACAGIDQRKAHVLAREVGERLGWGKPICIHTPLLMGLAGISTLETSSYDEDPKISQVIAAKMSKSKPENNILVHDQPEQITDKLRSEEHTSELQSLRHLVCRLLLEKKKKKK